MMYWGKMGAFWGGFWGLLFGSAFFAIPGVGPVLVAGPKDLALHAIKAKNMPGWQLDRLYQTAHDLSESLEQRGSGFTRPDERNCNVAT